VAPSFSPTQLSGYVNSPYNIALLRSQGKLWQDTAMTVAATADGDPVRRIDCAGTYYDAPSDAARPLLYDEGSGKWSLSFDGVDDCLLSPSHAWFPSKRGALFLSATNTAAGTGAVMTTYIGTAPDFEFFLRASGAGSGTGGYYDGSGTHYFATGVLSGWRTWGVVRSANATMDAYIDSDTPESWMLADNQPAAQTLSIGKVKGASSEIYNGRIAGLIALDAAPSAGDVVSLNAYLAALHP
jgi:hypothetical protein